MKTLCQHDKKALKDYAEFRKVRASFYIHPEEWCRLSSRTKRAISRMCLLAVQSVNNGKLMSKKNNKKENSYVV